MFKYDNLSLVFARYNKMVELDHGAGRRTIKYHKIPAKAWEGIAERLMCSGLTNLVRGDRLQFLADRVNDAFSRAGVEYRWNISRML